jgi:hypothetical protein
LSTQTIQSGNLHVATGNNKELVKLIGRQLRDTLELSAAPPPSLDIELRLEMLKYIEGRPGARLFAADRSELNDRIRVARPSEPDV